jgi:hypothetical protein
VRVRVGEEEFTALIDSGSTHNFFSTKAAQSVDLKFQEDAGARVIVFHVVVLLVMLRSRLVRTSLKLMLTPYLLIV